MDWETLPKVFGVTVTPRDGKTLGFEKDGTVTINISGTVLPGKNTRKYNAVARRGALGAWGSAPNPGFAARMLLGVPSPDPRWGSAPDPAGGPRPGMGSKIIS